MGEIDLITGPMFSGKSTELLRRLRRYSIASKKCCLLKYEEDLRYSSDSVCTHDNDEYVADMSATLIGDVMDSLKEFDVVAIDEGQFFKDIVPSCDSLANEGKIVIVAMLNSTFQRKPFESTIGIDAIAESTTKLKAVCVFCHKDAAFTKRRVEDTEEIVIGGSDKYVATCRTCHATK